MARPEEDPTLRFQFWKVMQERQNPTDKPNFNRLGVLELPRQQQLSLLFELFMQRPDYLQGGIRSFEGLSYPTDGNLQPLGVGAFIQTYIDEVDGYNDQYRDEPVSKDEEINFWFGLGFKMLGNSDEDTKELMTWVQDHPNEVVEQFAKEWIGGREYASEFLELAKQDKLKKIVLGR